MISSYSDNPEKPDYCGLLGKPTDFLHSDKLPGREGLLGLKYA